MIKTDFIKLVRKYLQDPDVDIYSDAELDDMIDKALIRYSFDSGLFKGTTDMLIDAVSKGVFPSDYLFFIAGFDTLGNAIQSVSQRDIDRIGGDIETAEDTPEAICDDLNNQGEYKLYPNPFFLENYVNYDAQTWGIPLYGDSYGLSPEDGDIGIIDDLEEYTFIGDIQYCRVGKLEEITDYMALILNILSQAYLIDTDMKNEKSSAVFLERYKQRVGGLQQIIN